MKPNENNNEEFYTIDQSKSWYKELEKKKDGKVLWFEDGSLSTHGTELIHLNQNSLEDEKKKFMEIMNDFVDRMALNFMQETGRPRFSISDILKSLLIMSYYSMSYRRAKSDISKMHEEGLILSIPSKSVLNKYANEIKTRDLIEKLIQYSAMFFIENESTIILDSTWFGIKMHYAGCKEIYEKKLSTLEKARKLHAVIVKNSRIIAFAKATKGTVNDSPMFEEMVKTVVKNGFNVSRLLADAGYTSKDNYLLCKDLKILNAFIDFRSNATTHRSKSELWRERVRMWKEQKELWHESYRFRVLIESVFSAIKRKSLNYLRSRTETAQDVELLLKALVYNLTVIGKFS